MPASAASIKLLILLYHRFDLWCAPEWLGPRLQEALPQVHVVQLQNYDRVHEEIADADAALMWSVRPEQFLHAKKLRWIHSTAAAVHQLMFPELVTSNVVVTNARDVHAPVVAEHVMALIFALAKRLPQAMQAQSRHEWAQEAMWHTSPPVREVAGATLGLVGLGSIGRETARRADALGMRVLAVREHPEKGTVPGVERVFGPSEMDAMLAESDYVVLASPVTPQTRHLLNAAHFAAMKRDAYLINVGRGPLVEEAALIAALQSRQIAGAALDVFDTEPLHADSPLWELDNLLITPHTAAITDKLWERQFQLIAQNMQRFLAGDELLSIVDKSKGY